MRPFRLKSITHSSGKQLPLLSIDNVNGEIEWAIQAMPLIQQPNTEAALIKACLKNGNGSGIEKYLFDLPLCFDRAIVDKNIKPAFITKGELKLADLLHNETYVNIAYSGINAQFVLHAAVYEHRNLSEFLTNTGSTLHLINHFSLIHPDDAQVEKEYEFKMPFKDLFILSDVNPERAARSYTYIPDEMRYQPSSSLQKSRNKLRAGNAPSALLEKNGELVNTNNILAFNKATRINTLVNSDIIANKLNGTNTIHHGLLLADLSTVQIIKKPDLPLNEEIKPGIYKDKQKNDTAWYQAILSLAKPTAGTSFLVAPFQFLFSVKGTDTQGKPVLESEITVTIKCSAPGDLAGITATNLKRIPMQNVSVTLSIPFTDNNGNKKTSDIISTSVTPEEDSITARFILNNEWTRVAYAAISSSDTSGSSAAKLKVSYLFRVYTKVTGNKIDFISLHKFDKLQILKSAPRAFKPVANVFISSHNTVMTPAGTSIKYETAVAQPNKISLSAHVNAASFINNVPQAPVNVADKVDYKIDSLLYNNEIELSLSCSEYGEYYQEEKDDKLTPVGCKEPYKLGEVPLTLYTEMTELRDAAYKVLRSNQVPNRFVILPTRYVISRNSLDMPSPLSPNLILYSTFDVNNITDSHSVLNAVLQPDIEYFNIIRLIKILKHYTSYEPDVLFINEIETSKSYEWSLPDTLYLSNTAVAIGNFINYTIVCEIDKALTLINMLKTASQGINGVTRYGLPDGANYTSVITVNIGEVEGPWLDNPLRVVANAETVQLENLLDTTIDVAGLYTDQGFDVLNFSLAPKSKTIVPLRGRTNVVVQYSIHPSAGDIDEIHSYSENINCQLIFIDTSGKDISGFSGIKLLYSLATDTQSISVSIDPENMPLEAMLPIPLTKYLSERIIHYKIQATKKADGTAIDTPWQTADLSAGNIINLNSQITTYFI